MDPKQTQSPKEPDSNDGVLIISHEQKVITPDVEQTDPVNEPVDSPGAASDVDITQPATNSQPATPIVPQTAPEPVDPSSYQGQVEPAVITQPVNLPDAQTPPAAANPDSAVAQVDLHQPGDQVVAYTDPLEAAAAVPTETRWVINWRAIGLLGVGLVVVIGLVIIGLSALGGSSAGYYKTVVLKNKGYSYTFLFDPNYNPGSVSGYNYLTGNNLTNKLKINVAVYPSLEKSSCNANNSLLLVEFDINVQGKSYPACTDTLHDSISSMYKENGVWQEVSIWSPNLNKAIDNKTAKEIISSVKVTQ